MHNASVIIRYALCTTRPWQKGGTNNTWVMVNKWEEGENEGKVKHLQVLRCRGR